jgi:hypothetical protein
LPKKRKEKKHSTVQAAEVFNYQHDTRHQGDIQAKAATDRNLTETPSHLLSLASRIHRFFPFPFRSSPTPPSRRTQSPILGSQNLPDLRLQASRSPPSYETNTNQVSSRGERGNLLGRRSAACFIRDYFLVPWRRRRCFARAFNLFVERRP